MPATAQDFPTRDEVIDYPGRYEERDALPVSRPAFVESVERSHERLVVRSGPDTWLAQAAVSATGNRCHSHIPTYPGRETFTGPQLHSAE